MKWTAALVVGISLLGAETAHSQVQSVTAIRHWSLTDVTRVAVEVSGEFRFRTDRLHNPERVYFDILDARPSADARRGLTQDVGDKLLKRIRLAETMPGITRVVLDLTDGVEAVPSQLANPSRLIIELRSGAAPAIPPVAPTPVPPVLSSAASLPKTLDPQLSKPVQVEAPPPVTAEPSKAQLANDAAPAAEPAVTAKIEIAKTVELPASGGASLAESAKSARHTSNGENSLIRALGLKINRIVIDPGHGGHDQGTTGPKGLLEKELVLDVAKRLGKLIGERMGSEVIYTRTDDSFVPLEGRTALANEKKADLFLSIHANSSPAPRVTGIETYYLNFTESKDALDVAARENASSEKSVFELHDLIQKITLHDKAEESREFAGRIQTSLYAFSARTFPGEKNRGVRKAPFVVLIGANMPSVLAEIGFLSNPKEETLLKKPEYRQKLAEALFRGVSKYADGLSHYQMAQN